MKITINEDERGYPFEVTPDAITSNFALFKQIYENREEFNLALSKNDEYISSIIDANAENQNIGEFFGRGFVSYAGNETGVNRHKWISGMPIHKEGLSDAVLAALRSDIEDEAKRCFKGDSDGNGTSEKHIGDIESTHHDFKWNAESIHPDLVGRNILIESVIPQNPADQTTETM